MNKETLKTLIISLIKVSENLISFQKDMDKDKTHYKDYDKWIRHCRNAINNIKNIQHIEILASIYNSFLSGKESYFIILSESVYKNAKRWDTTKKGFEEFMQLDKEARTKYLEEKEERQKQLDAIKAAREQGKKVDFVLKDGKVVPIIVEEKPN